MSYTIAGEDVVALSLCPEHGYVLDIGAGCETWQSNSALAIDRGWDALLIEGDPRRLSDLQKVIGNRPGVEFKSAVITPENVDEVLDRVPDLLSVDIDSYDLAVLEAIFRVCRPGVVISEINENIPPPVEFEVLYPNGWWPGNMFFGYSLARGARMWERYGYGIHSLHVNNVILTRQPPWLDVVTAYRRGYIEIDATLRKRFFSHNDGHLHMATSSKEEVVSWLRDKFSSYSNFHLS